VVHGLTVPLGRLWFYIPQTLSRGGRSTDAGTDVPPFTLGSRVTTFAIRRPRSSGELQVSLRAAPPEPERPVFRVGGNVIPKRHEGAEAEVGEVRIRAEGPESSETVTSSAAETVRVSFAQPPTPRNGEARTLEAEATTKSTAQQ
jgi:hypothetical protein